MTDMVNHPPHYMYYKREVIDLTERCDFCTGNAFKYILRAPFKGSGKEDLEKAKWYINRLKQTARDLKIDYEVSQVANDYSNDLFIAVFQAMYMAKSDITWLDKAIEYIDDRISML